MPIGLPIRQSDRGIFSVKTLSFQMTLACVKSRKHYSAPMSFFRVECTLSFWGRDSHLLELLKQVLSPVWWPQVVLFHLLSTGIIRLPLQRALLVMWVLQIEVWSSCLHANLYFTSWAISQVSGLCLQEVLWSSCPHCPWPTEELPCGL